MNSVGALRVMLPEGVTPGQQLPINIPGRGVMVVTLPANAHAGQYVDVFIPTHDSPGAHAGAPPLRASAHGHLGASDLGASLRMQPTEQRSLYEHPYRQELKSVSIVLPENSIPGQQLQVRVQSNGAFSCCNSEVTLCREPSQIGIIGQVARHESKQRRHLQLI